MSNLYDMTKLLTICLFCLFLSLSRDARFNNVVETYWVALMKLKGCVRM